MGYPLHRRTEPVATVERLYVVPPARPVPMPRFYTAAEVARDMRVSPETIYKVCREGNIPGIVKVGKQYRITEAARRAIIGGDAGDWGRR